LSAVRRGFVAAMKWLLCISPLVVVGCSASAAPAERTNAQAVAPTALPSGGDLFSRCTDAVGDTGGMDLAEVTLVSQGDQLIVEFAFAHPVPTKGIVILTVEARSEDGGQIRQLGIALQDGQPVAVYVSTPPNGQPVRVITEAHIAPGAVHAAFPANVVAPLGSGWSWFATDGGKSAVDDYCPDSKGDTVEATSVARSG
jgi:hypothetical protein